MTSKTREAIKEIVGYEGKYWVTRSGDIISNYIGKKKALALCDNGEGYYTVYLYKNGVGTHYKVHRLVAQAFIPNHKPGLMINHRDTNKKNNAAENLEWVTNSQNMIHASKNGKIRFFKKVPDSEVGVIMRRILGGDKLSEIAKDYNITSPGVSYIAVRAKKLGVVPDQEGK